MTQIAGCKCKNDYQDKKYGHMSRVFNKTAKGWRCTVCGSDKGDSGVSVKKDRK